MVYYQRYGRKLSFLVEGAGAGISLIYTMRKAGISCFSYYPKESKQFRASLALPIIHAKRVHILNKPGENDWVEPYINEFVTFPHGRFDDQVDSLVQLLPWAESRINPVGRGFFT